MANDWPVSYISVIYVFYFFKFKVSAISSVIVTLHTDILVQYHLIFFLFYKVKNMEILDQWLDIFIQSVEATLPSGLE